MLRQAVVVALAASAVAGCSGDGGDAGDAATAVPHSTTRVIEQCPELPERCAAVMQWLSRVVERAGYRITGDTGSALIATGLGRQSFYAWATKLNDGVPRERKRWPSVGVVSGVRLYGGKQRRWWLTQGFGVWIEAGPFEHSILPPKRALARLIAASFALPAPITHRLG
jgi:hypothetical protein